ncbi:MAG: hypothetical protein NTY77_06315 [Elusimicrobia bacterium]|nr:hypothetical protein [Elusimicrobiota bacterium]
MTQAQDPCAPVQPELAKTVAAIGFAASVLGLFCLYDALREALGAYQYHTAIPVLSIYKGVLGIYAAARQGHQWSDPDAKPSRGGRFFVLAWLGLPVFLNALEVGRLWFPPPIQPADLNNTLNWVIGYYVFGKASTLARLNGYRPLGLGKNLVRAPLPEERLKIMADLRLAVDVLGAICIFDVLREGITPPYQSGIDIHSAYRLALAAYAGTNQWRKWVDPQADSPRAGFGWVLAWLGVLVLLKGLTMISSDNIIVMPQQLTGTLLWVFSIYGLGKAPAFFKWNPVGSGLPRPRPEPGPKPEDPGQDPATPAPPPAEGGQTPDDGSDSDLEAVAAACEQAGEFSRADIVGATGMNPDRVKRKLDELLRRGWIERIKFGRYRWKGRHFWKGRRADA